VKFRDIPMLTTAGSYEVNAPLDSLMYTIERYQKGDRACAPLDLLPDFQRGHVWTQEQQIAYVEFFLRGGMTGRTIYLNCPNWGGFQKIPEGGYRDFVIVDGLQRLTALLAFVRGEIPAFEHYVRQKTVVESVFGQYGGPYFEDGLLQADANFNLRININNLKTKKAVLQWYLEMNSGSTPHTNAELDKVRGMIKEEK
jgi:hypothetical protein